MGQQHASEGVALDRPAPVVEAVLALVIESPSYPYEVWKRYRERFGDYHSVTKARIYQVIHQLADGELIEVLEERPDAPGGPKSLYRATAQGAVRYREWLAAGIRNDPRRDELLRRLVATGARSIRSMLQVVDVYHQAYLDDLSSQRALSANRGAEPQDRLAELCDKLIDEEHRLTQEAQLRFVTFARRTLREALEAEESQ